MNRTYSIIITLVLLLMSANTKAQNQVYRGTLHELGWKMEYSFSGGVVKSKKREDMASYMAVRIEGEVLAGAKLTASCKKLLGLQAYNTMEVHYTVKMKSGADPGATSKEGNGSASASMVVPDNADEVYASMSYKGLIPLHCIVKWKVVKTLSTSTTTTGAVTETGTIENGNGSLTYTIEGGVVKRKGNFNMNRITYDIEVAEGARVKLSGVVKKKNAEYDNEISIGYTFGDHRDTQSAKGSKEIEFVVPTGAAGWTWSTSAITAHFQAQNSLQLLNPKLKVEIDWIVVKGAAPPANSFTWDDVSTRNKCKICNEEYSEYHMFSGNSGLGVRCRDNTNGGWREVEDAIDVIYYNDYVVTQPGTINNISHGDEANVLVFYENTKALLKERLSNGNDRWLVYQGKIVGKYFKPVDHKPEFSMSSCTANPKGTIFILEDDGNTSRVFLLSGSMDVTSKKTNKKVKLKPGEVSTVGTSGEVNIQKFDVHMAAQRYGITSAELQEQGVTPTSSQKRYKLERAIIKYNVTNGNQKGVLAKCFDNYGIYERRELKMGNKKTINIVQGETTYELNPSTKKYIMRKKVELNFLDLSAEFMKRQNFKKKGSATVIGKKCTVYTSGNSEFYVWEGIVLKKVSRSGNTTSVIEAISIEEPTSIDASTFKLPSGYSKQ